MISLIRTFIFTYLIFGGIVTSLQAHDPFDGATRMFVREKAIDIEVTMGSDAAREFLKGAGLPALEEDGGHHEVFGSS